MTPARWAIVSLPFAFCLERLIRGRLGDDLLLPLGERLEPVAHPGELLDGKLLLGLAASLLELVLGILQIGQGFLFLLAGLVALVLVQVVLGLLHPAPGAFAGPCRPVGAQLGQPLKLPLQVLADLGLLLGQPLELLLALLGIRVPLRLAGLLQVLRPAGRGSWPARSRRS